jgi:hypothetical protein
VHFWLDLRLWVQPGPHTLLALFKPSQKYFERHFSTVPREQLHRLRALAPDGPLRLHSLLGDRTVEFEVFCRSLTTRRIASSQASFMLR